MRRMIEVNIKKISNVGNNSFFYFLSLIILSIVQSSSETEIIEHDKLCKKVIFKLSLISQQNEDGKWETHAQLDRGNETVSDENDQDLHLDIRQTLVACNCTNKMLSVEANIVAPPLRPGSNYTLHPGLGYYYLHKTPYLWAEANYFCNGEGAHLTVLNSETAGQHVKRILEESDLPSGSQMFVGLQRHANGDIKTLYGATYHKPNGLSYSDEVPISGSLTDSCGTVNNQGKLNFVSCDQMLPFMCEQEE